MELTPQSPLLIRLGGYLNERFPPVVYTILVVLFFGGSAAMASHLAGGSAAADWRGAVIIWLVFLHLRLLDEQKDFAVDAVAHPTRLLSRGVVTLPLLGRLLLVVVVLEGVLAWTMGSAVFGWWVGTLLFTGLMRVEFFVGDWLQNHLIVYAVTHNPVVALLTMVAWASADVAWSPDFLWVLAVTSLGSLAFELGRKLRLPDEEVEGVDSYSSVLGHARARLLLRCVMFVGVFALLPLTTGDSIERGPLGLGVLALVVGWVTSHRGASAKKIETGASLLLLMLLSALWWLGVS